MGTIYFYLKPLVLLFFFIDMPSDLLSIDITSNLLLAEDEVRKVVRGENKNKTKQKKESNILKHQHWKDSLLFGWSLIIQFYLTTKQRFNLKEEACQHLQATWGLYLNIYQSPQDKSFSLLSTVFIFTYFL